MQKLKSKAGRKPKNGKAAMSSAERQKAYRQRKAGKNRHAQKPLDMGAVRSATDILLNRIYFLEEISRGWDSLSYFHGLRPIRILERTLEESIRLPLFGEAAKDSRYWKDKAERAERFRKLITDL